MEQNILPAQAENVAEVTTEETNVSEVEFSDTEVATDDVVTEKPTETLAERNRKAYEMRQARKKSKATKVAVEEKRGEKKVLVNSYTGQPIETDEDMEDFKLMQTIEEEGGDAILDFPEYLSKKRKGVAEEVSAQQQAKNDNQANLMQELDSQLSDIKQSLGVDAEELYSKNKAFREFANEMIDDGAPLKSIVKTWKKFEQKNNEEVERRARDLLSKGNAIPPIKSAAPPATKSVSEMTNKEFEDLKRRVKMGEY